ncbi:hypothetical protein [Diaphorobacter sp.]|uniref:hypothetical protein n=1 Tax=Diaphorobacter sp. TaxID=1934310 RepID=UPI002584BD9A|nr:hypothetical protein [Diaphorobacter sp.]
MSFLLTTLIPLLGLVLTVALVSYAFYARYIDVPNKPRLDRRVLVALCAVAVVCDAWLGLRLYLSGRAQQTRQDSAVHRTHRERFVLPHDVQYGELVIPAGSLINRLDPFDNGAPVQPVSLRGLEAVRFSQPVLVAGVWAQAMQVLPMRVELAQDQRIGPLYRYNTDTKEWELNKVVPALLCRQGQIALFQVPQIPYDVQAEVGKPAPDGPQARFLPSQWQFRNCENGPAIDVQPAHPASATALAPAPELLPPPPPAEPASDPADPASGAASAPASAPGA